MDIILNDVMLSPLKVLFVRLKRLWAPPGHVAYKLLLAKDNFSFGLSGKGNGSYRLSGIPMPHPMDIKGNVCRLTQLFPMRLEGFVVVGVASLRQEQWIRVI